MSEGDLQKVSLQFQADEHAAQTAAASRVAEFQAATAAPPAPAAPLTPEQETAAKAKLQQEQLAALATAMLPQLCLVAWSVADRLVQQAGGKELALTDDEKKLLADATGPVVTKYLPEGLEWLVTSPEGALVLCAAMVYGPKLLIEPPAAAAPPPAAPPAAPPVTA